jgi:hypothetical protein
MKKREGESQGKYVDEKKIKNEKNQRQNSRQ